VSQQTQGRVFYDEQIAALEAQDIERLMAQYAEEPSW
jgi:hypothetical protein